MKTTIARFAQRIAMHTTSLHRPARTGLLVLLGLLLGLPGGSLVAQNQGVCARVKIVILQELTLERIGFEATLEVTNNDGEEPITDFSAQLTFENPILSTDTTPHDATPFFFVRAPVLENINAADGTGIIAPTRKATLKWFIIPKIAAGGQDPNGVRYKVGCNLAGRIRGVEIPKDILFAIPDDIYVKPEPQLEITYFQPREVFADDPFTPEVEAPEPFTLGVLVKNAGYGFARKLQIDSQQPRIVENRRNLLLVAQLLGTRVNDSALSTANLLVNLGDIPPGQARKGAWDMITSLTGEFVEFKASYTHASELGGEETSVITSLEAHFIEREVLNDQPGRDGIKEFLADTDRDAARLPDAMYESEGNILPVNHLAQATVQGTAGPGGSFQVSVEADRAGWGYLRVDDPGQAKYPIASVLRSDGKVLNPNNYWAHRRYVRGVASDETFLSILDLVDLQSYTYTVTYAAATADTTPPVTTLKFAGDYSERDGRFYITPETQMYFLSEDASTVSIVYSVTNGPFLPALPFTIRTPGEYPIVYYATDAFANREENQAAVLVVSVDPPGLAQFSGVTGAIFVPGGALSIRPHQASFSYEVGPSPTAVDGRFDVFQGAVGWVSVGQVPASPTRLTSATLALGGDHIDYYRYRLNGGPWSDEAPVAAPLTLAGLTARQHTVEVLGRPAGGIYPPAEQAVAVSWVVDPAAPPTEVTGAPVTPTRGRTAQLVVGGPGVTHYRWTLDDGSYRAEAPIATPILLDQLAAGERVIKVLARAGGPEQPSPSVVRWVIDPDYGSDFSLLRKVRSVTVPNIPAGLQTFNWDGRDDIGAILEPGVYTVRLTLSDRLGRTNYYTRLVQLGEFAGAARVMASADRGPRNPHARGRYAVWQDQSDGNDEIYAQDLTAAAPTIRQITDGTRANTNPKTDGRYVVWQARQADGNWDIVVRDLTVPGSDVLVTATPAMDETAPSMDWPWVVYQTRPLSNPAAPPQLKAYNLATHTESDVWPGPLEQLDPDVQAGRVVWQDHRDVGQGEIYFKDLETGVQRRLTINSYGQYHPVIHGHIIAWQDNRNGQVDLYGFDLLRNVEVRLTNTGENEARPYLEGPWLMAEEDSLGPLTGNLKLLHVPSLRSVPLTRSSTQKTRAALAHGRAVWQETEGGATRLAVAELPTLQAVFQNQNAVAVTEAMATYQQTAFPLLRQWNVQAGVTELHRFTSLLPTVAQETARMEGGVPTGADFPLVPGSFLWVQFGTKRLLDLGVNAAGTFNFPAGVSVLSHTRFPNGYSAFQLLRQLGLERARGVRMLDAEAGRWSVAEVQSLAPPGGGPPVPTAVGDDFTIPNVAVLFIELTADVNLWKPE